MSKSDSSGTNHVCFSSCSISISGKKWRVVSREMKNVSNSEDARGIPGGDSAGCCFPESYSPNHAVRYKRIAVRCEGDEVHVRRATVDGQYEIKTHCVPETHDAISAGRNQTRAIRRIGERCDAPGASS